jgi:hypothetical protein
MLLPRREHGSALDARQIGIQLTSLTEQRAGTANYDSPRTRVHRQPGVLSYLRFGPVLAFYRIYTIRTHFITTSRESI